MTADGSGSLRALFKASPRITGALLVVAAILIGANVVAATRWLTYRREIEQLRADMSDGERNRADLALQSAENRAKVQAEQIRRQAHADRELHLTVQLDSSRMLLERDGVVLREIPVALGRTGLVGAPPDSHLVARPRGARAVSRVISAGDRWDIPGWLYADRHVPVPPADQRQGKGILGRSAFLLADGSPIYALPTDGLLADSSYVMPGAILLRSEDMRAIAPNIAPGLTVYLYE
ncbi:MAG: hypothetical protein U0132_01480 [Gemmatimonadaceae bacterium]